MKNSLLFILAGLTGIYSANAQTKTVTVDANDALNNNTKIVAQTSNGQIFFTGHQLGNTYSLPNNGIFRAWTDNPNGSTNVFYDGIAAGVTNFSVRADGQGYFAGNVGIGTTTPSAPLTVDPQGAGGILIGNPNTATGGFTSLSFKISAKQNGYSTIESIQSGGSAYGNLFINPNAGNVGIGVVDTKGYKFAVNGSVIATSMTVKAAGNWPDYVFKKNYQLPSLQDVKAYIDQNQHLPEIPSEQQIAKEGLNLGEMNKLLMKKVEELTLYLIEKDQKEAQQAKINEIQEARIHKLEEQLNLLTNRNSK